MPHRGAAGPSEAAMYGNDFGPTPTEGETAVPMPDQRSDEALNRAFERALAADERIERSSIGGRPRSRERGVSAFDGTRTDGHGATTLAPASSNRPRTA